MAPLDGRPGIADSYRSEGPGPGATLHRPCGSPSPCTCSPSSSGRRSSRRFPDPAYPDSVLLRRRGRIVAAGHGFNVDFIWIFAEVGGAIPANPVLPIPATPTGCRSPRSSRCRSSPSSARPRFASALPFALIGALAAPLTWSIARDAGAPDVVAVGAGVLIAIPAPDDGLHVPARQLRAVPAARRRRAVDGGPRAEGPSPLVRARRAARRARDAGAERRRARRRGRSALDVPLGPLARVAHRRRATATRSRVVGGGRLRRAVLPRHGARGGSASSRCSARSRRRRRRARSCSSATSASGTRSRRRRRSTTCSGWGWGRC